jgi:hypothetical protein
VSEIKDVLTFEDEQPEEIQKPKDIPPLEDKDLPQL